jgi:intein-encoded DNA endonuclease-like protein
MSRSNLNFEPSLSLSIMIGTFLAEGCLYAPKNRVIVEASDEAYVRQFLGACRAIGSGVSFVREHPAAPTRTIMYRVEIESKSLFAYLQEARTPSNEASEVALMFPREFLGAFFDGDGCIYPNFKIAFDNSKEEVINLLEECLHSLEFSPYKTQSLNRTKAYDGVERECKMYRLNLARPNEVWRFIQTIPSLKCKRFSDNTSTSETTCTTRSI